MIVMILSGCVQIMTRVTGSRCRCAVRRSRQRAAASLRRMLIDRLLLLLLRRRQLLGRTSARVPTALWRQHGPRTRSWSRAWHHSWHPLLLNTLIATPAGLRCQQRSGSWEDALHMRMHHLLWRPLWMHLRWGTAVLLWRRQVLLLLLLLRLSAVSVIEDHLNRVVL